MTQLVSELDKLVTEFRRILPKKGVTAKAIDRQEPWQQVALSAVAMLFCVAAGSALAEGAGHVQNLSGTLFVQRPDGAVRVLGQKSEVNPGDKLTTLKNSFAQIDFIDGSSMTLRPNTQINIEAFQFLHDEPEADNAFFRLIRGGIRTVTGLVGKRGDMNAYKIRTTLVVVGIRGSSGDTLDCVTGCEGVSSTSDRLERGVYHATYTGSYVLQNENGLEIVNEGQVGFAKNTNSAPRILPSDPGLNLLNAPFMVAFASDRAYRDRNEDGKQGTAISHGQTIGQRVGTDGGQRTGQGSDAGGNQGMGQGNGQSTGQGNGVDDQSMGRGNRIGVGDQSMGQRNGIGQSMGQGNGIGNQGMGQGNGNGNGNGIGAGQGMGQGFGVGVDQSMGRSFGVGVGGLMDFSHGHSGGRHENNAARLRSNWLFLCHVECIVQLVEEDANSP